MAEQWSGYSDKYPKTGPYRKLVLFWKNMGCSIRKKEQDPEFMLKLSRIVGMEETQKLSKKPDFFLLVVFIEKTKEVYIYK